MRLVPAPYQKRVISHPTHEKKRKGNSLSYLDTRSSGQTALESHQCASDLITNTGAALVVRWNDGSRTVVATAGGSGCGSVAVAVAASGYSAPNGEKAGEK